ncbi:MAG: hypothetical protein ACP5SI_09500 [Chloroflexia bacterium]
MKRVWKWAGIAILVAILGAGVLGAVALAQGTGTETSGPFDFRERFRQAIANILGISVEAYDKAVEQARDQVLNEAVSEGWLTQDQADRMRERMELGLGFGPWGKGRGFGRGFGWGVDLISVAAEKLGMSASDLVGALRDGKSIAQIAQEKGVDVQTIADAYIAKLEERLKQAVAEGKLGQKMADWMLEQARKQVNDWLEQTWSAPFPGMPRGGRWGRPFWNCPCTRDSDSGDA